MRGTVSFFNDDKKTTVRKFQRFQAYSAVGQPGSIYSIEVEWDEKSGQPVIYEHQVREVFRGEVHDNFLVKNGENVSLYLRDRVDRSTL